MMRSILAILTFTVLMLVWAKPAEAIIVLPAIVLIPIAKIVAFVIGALSIPTIGIGAMAGKIWGKSYLKGIIISLSVIIILGIIMMVFLKSLYPDKPWI